MQIRPWTIVAHLDATRRDLEPWETREAADFQNHASPDAYVVMQIRRRPVSALREKSWAALEMAALPAAVAIGAAAALTMPPLAAAFLGSKLLTPSVLAFVHGLKRLRRAQQLPQIHQEPAWRGTRTYDMTDATAAAGQRLQAPILHSSAATAAPTASNLAELLVDSSRRYPSQYTALLLSGRGEAYRGVAGMSMDQVGEALSTAAAANGKPLDLVVLEGCKLGNLEALRPLAGHARYALVSEEKLWAVGLPWPYILSNLMKSDPRDLGQSVVRIAGGLDQVPTLSLIDLDKIPALSGSLQDLAATIGNSGHDKEIRQAFSQALKVPRASSVALRLASTPVLHLADLGSVLRNLERTNSVAVVDAARRASDAHAAAVVASQVHARLRDQAHGLTIEAPSMLHFDRSYREHGLAGWGDMVARLSPWRGRVGHVVEAVWRRLAG